MPGAQPRKSQQRQIGAAVQRNTASGGGPGGYGVNTPRSNSGADDGGLKECFTIPDFVPGTHDLGYDHWICDPNGTFDET